MGHTRVLVTIGGRLAADGTQPHQLPLVQRVRQQPRLLRAGGIRLGLALLHQKSLRRGAPAVPQQRLQAIPRQRGLFGVQPGQQRHHRQQPSGGKGAAQLRTQGAERVLLPVVLQQYAAGADGLQQDGGGGGAEDKGGIGRPLLHYLQQHVLIPLVELAAVRKDIDLPGGLVGADVDVLAQVADGLHGHLPVLGVLHVHHVRVDALQHLAAVAAAQAGLVRALADVGGGQKPRGGGQVAPAGEDHRVAEPPLGGGAAHRAGEYAVFRGKLHHRLTPFA